jgi:hypothetical protein
MNRRAEWSSCRSLMRKRDAGRSRRRAFDPFFTTKPPGKGTGFDLSQVFGVVSQPGGDVSINSKSAEGADIRIRLRRSDSKPQAILKVEQALTVSSAERVLIVDDDDDVRRVVSGILSDIGYTVPEPATGAEALGAMRDKPAYCETGRPI